MDVEVCGVWLPVGLIRRFTSGPPTAGAISNAVWRVANQAPGQSSRAEREGIKDINKLPTVKEQLLTSSLFLRASWEHFQAWEMMVNCARRERSSHPVFDCRVVGSPYPSPLPLQLSVNAKTAAAAIVEVAARVATGRFHNHGRCGEAGGWD